MSVQIDDSLIAFSWVESTGTVRCTLYYKPGDATPRLAVHNLTDGTAVGRDIEAPERFGPVGTTPREFAEWCARYIWATT